MDELNFLQSRMMAKFIEWTMPELVSQITKLNEHLEKLIALEEEPIKSVGDINKEIKEGMNNIVNIRKDLINDN